MAIDKKVNYVCDRCHKEHLEPSLEERQLWRTITSAAMFSKTPDYLLCGSCATEFERWIGVAIPVTLLGGK